MSNLNLSEQEIQRRASLQALRDLGIDPYPAARYDVTATAGQIAAEYNPEVGNFSDITIAGRLMSRRIMGSASFFELQDHTGRIQVYIRRDDVCPESDTNAAESAVLISTIRGSASIAAATESVSGAGNIMYGSNAAAISSDTA